MVTLVPVACCILFIAIIPYIVYLLGITFGKRSQKTGLPDKFPCISIVISAYNEERVVQDRIANLAQSRYPKELYEVIFVDDCSDDNTCARAQDSLEKSGITFRIIPNSERMGTNRSYNRAMALARYPVIVTTDADVFFEPDALGLLIGRLLSDSAIAAVTGELQPVLNEYETTNLERAYRSFYGRMCDWESAIDSTFNFNGALVAFRADLIHRIDDKRGADDANTAFEAIRKGYRAVYEPRAVVYEDVPSSFRIQYRQKIRRAKQLIEATCSNLDLLRKNRPFTRYFYPLRLFMYVCTPILFFIGVAILAAGLYLAYPLILAALVGIAIITGLIWRQNLFNAFVVNQFYLLMGLLNMGKDTRVWESTSKKRTG